LGQCASAVSSLSSPFALCLSWCPSSSPVVSTTHAAPPLAVLVALPSPLLPTLSCHRALLQRSVHSSRSAPAQPREPAPTAQTLARWHKVHARHRTSLTYNGTKPASASCQPSPLLPLPADNHLPAHDSLAAHLSRAHTDSSLSQQHLHHHRCHPTCASPPPATCVCPRPTEIVTLTLGFRLAAAAPNFARLFSSASRDAN
jgi:hypothetical protein